MRRGLTGFALLVFAASAAAQAPTATTIRLTLRPAAAPDPALKDLLLPELSDRTPGNAVLLYYRAFSPEWYTNLRRDPKTMEEIQKSLDTPLGDLPRKKIGWVLHSKMLRDVDRAARRTYCDWEMIEGIRRDNIGFLLPDVGGLREIASMLAARARLQIADGHFDKAVYTLQTGMTLGRHLNRAPTLIQSLVGMAIAQSMLKQVETLIQTPDSPNLYWALTELPRPLMDQRAGLQGERIIIQSLLPELAEVEKGPLGPRQLAELVKKLEGLVMDVNGPTPRWRMKLALIAAVTRSYPEARRALIAQGRTADAVDALPAVQVFALAGAHEFRRQRDDLFKWMAVPYPEAFPRLREHQARLKKEPALLQLGALLLPALEKVYAVQARLDRHVAILRCVEAVRLHAVAHGGKLPAALGDITAVPVPRDPMTGKPFAYKVSEAKATLHAPPPAGIVPAPENNLLYELMLKK